MAKIDRNRLKSSIEEGKRQSEIAKSMGCSRAAICKQVKLLEIEKTKLFLSTLLESRASEIRLEDDRAIMKKALNSFMYTSKEVVDQYF